MVIKTTTMKIFACVALTALFGTVVVIEATPVNIDMNANINTMNVRRSLSSNYESSNELSRENLEKEIEYLSQRVHNVEGDVDAVWREGFENLKTGSNYLNDGELQVVEGSMCYSGNKCVRATYIPTDNGSERITKTINLPPAREYTLNYDVKFEHDFEYQRGGKLMGLASKKTISGCKPETKDTWSQRIMWRQEGTIESYTYGQDRQNRCGDTKLVPLETFNFQKGKWHSVSIYVNVNYPASKSNGSAKVFVDGIELIHLDNQKFRGEDGDHTLISTFMLNTFHGGSSTAWSPSKTVYAYFDNFAVIPGLKPRHSPDLYL